jgi:nicotinamidase
LAIPRAADVLPVIAELAEAAWGWEVVVVSQDYHPVGHLSFASSHGAEPFTSAVIKGKGDRDYKQMLWCEQRAYAGLSTDSTA